MALQMKLEEGVEEVRYTEKKVRSTVVGTENEHARHLYLCSPR